MVCRIIAAVFRVAIISAILLPDVSSARSSHLHPMSKTDVDVFRMEAFLEPYLLGAWNSLHPLASSRWKKIVGTAQKVATYEETFMRRIATSYRRESLAVLIPAVLGLAFVAPLIAMGLALKLITMLHLSGGAPIFPDGEPTTSEEVLNEFRVAIGEAASDPEIKPYLSNREFIDRFVDIDLLLDFKAVFVHRTAENAQVDPKEFVKEYFRKIIQFETGKLKLSDLAAPVGWGLGYRKFALALRRERGGPVSLFTQGDIQARVVREGALEAQDPDVLEVFPTIYRDSIGRLGPDGGVRPPEDILVARYQGRHYLLYASSSHSEPGKVRRWRAAYGGLRGRYIEKQAVESADDLQPDLCIKLDALVPEISKVEPALELEWNSGRLGVRYDREGVAGDDPVPESIDPSSYKTIWERTYPVADLGEFPSKAWAARAAAIAENLHTAYRDGILPYHPLLGAGIHSVYQEDPFADWAKVLVSAHPTIQIDDTSLLHVIDNAVEAIAARYRADSQKFDGYVRVRIALHSSGALDVFVEDNGIGISKATLQKLFLEVVTTKERRPDTIQGSLGQAIYSRYADLVTKCRVTITMQTAQNTEEGGSLYVGQDKADLRKIIAPITWPTRGRPIGTTVRFHLPETFLFENVPRESWQVYLLSAYDTNDWPTINAALLGVDAWRSRQALSATSLLFHSTNRHSAPFDYYMAMSGLADLAKKYPERIVRPALQALLRFLEMHSQHVLVTEDLDMRPSFGREALRMIEHLEKAGQTQHEELGPLRLESQKLVPTSSASWFDSRLWKMTAFLSETIGLFLLVTGLGKGDDVLSRMMYPSLFLGMHVFNPKDVQGSAVWKLTAAKVVVALFAPSWSLHDPVTWCLVLAISLGHLVLNPRLPQLEKVYTVTHRFLTAA